MASTKKIILITGANTGLGFEVVRALCGADKPYHILLGGRSMAKAQQATKDIAAEFPSTSSEVTPIQVDIEDDDSIEKAFQEVQSKYGKLDVLLNNAGAAFEPAFHEGQMTMRELWNKSWEVNTTGAQVMTHTFAPLLLQSADARLIFVTSGTATLAGTDDTNMPSNVPAPKGWPKPIEPLGVSAYRSAKTGMNMMMREWHRLLKGDGVKVLCASPGFLATNLGGSAEQLKAMGAGDPALGGAFIKGIIEGERDADVGKVLSRYGTGIQAW